MRAAAGFGFFYLHGLPHLRPDGVWDWGDAFAASGGAPRWVLYTAAWCEFLGGFALMLGALTRWWSLALLGIVGYACFAMQSGTPVADRELHIAYAGLLLALLAMGPGPLSLDRLFFGRKAVPE